MEDRMSLGQMKFSMLLFGMAQALRIQARRFPAFAERLKEKNFTAQMKVADNSAGRYFTFRDGKVLSRKGIHPNPDVSLFFTSAELGAELLMPPIDQLAQIEAMKNFQMGMEGPDELT